MGVQTAERDGSWQPRQRRRRTEQGQRQRKRGPRGRQSRPGVGKGDALAAGGEHGSGRHQRAWDARGQAGHQPGERVFRKSASVIGGVDEVGG